MTFKKYNTANNAICSLDLPITNSSNIIIAKGNFNRFPTSNFIIKITQYNGSVVIGRENILISSRSGSTFSVSQRAVEPVPIDDNASNNIQQALSFDADSIIELVISSATITDIQDELTRLENDKLDKSTYNLERQVFSASSTGNDNYKITSSDILVYNNGQTFKIQADVGNTDASTLELNSLGAKTLKKYKDGALVELETGDIVTNQIFWATYNSVTNCFQFSIDPATTVVPNIKATKSVFTAGENLVVGNLACQPKYVFNLVQQLTGDNFNDGVQHTHGQTITVTGNNILQDFTGYFYSSASVNATLQMQIYSSVGGTLLGTYTKSQYFSPGQLSYKFVTNLNISSYSTLYVLFDSGTKYINNVFTTSDLYAGGQRYFDGSPATGDLKFEFTTLSDGLGKIYKTDASNEYNLSVTGIVTNNISTGGLVTLNTSGISDTQTGLTTGSDYYLSNTPGTISTTPGTNIVLVGKAVNSTGIQLDIDRVKQLSVITPTVGASPYTYQNTTGRPIIVSITGGTVSQVAYSRDNTNYYQTSGATNTFITLGVNDYVKITYTGTPTLKAFTL